jgi:protein SCO1/2
MSRWLKLLMIICVFASAFVFIGCEERENEGGIPDENTLNPARDFSLNDQDGRMFRLRDHRGKMIILFFGYISCPDVCPTTFSKLTRVYALLGAEGKDVLTVFVSVDPQRDTTDKIKEYLQYFKINAIGLTGTKNQIDEVVEEYKATYEKVETNSAAGYLFNHSDLLYLIDGEGRVRHLFHYADKAETITGIIRKLE